MYKLALYFSALFYLTSVSSNEYDNYYQDNEISQSSFGGIGLIQTPTARFSEDGQLRFGVSSDGPYRRIYGTVQFFPWLESVVRYTEGTYKPYYRGNLQTWKDKGIDLKLRLFNENERLPELAIGLQDLGGTGAYSSEYIVASKRYQNIDWTLGLGWGRLSGVDHFDNLAGWIDSNRKTRGGSTSLGGSIRFGRFFSGKTNSLFGGLEYFSPIDNLSFKLEYDSSDYSEVEGRESNFFKKGDIFKVDSRLNYALNYRYQLTEREQVDFALGFVRGNTIYANVSIHSGLNFAGTEKTKIVGEKLRNTNLPNGESFQKLDQNRKKFLTDRTIKEMARIGFVTHRIIYNGDELAAELSQNRFLDTSKFIDLASRVLSSNAPKNIKKITVINIDSGIETFRASVNRDDLIKSTRIGPLDEDLLTFYEYPDSKDKLISVDNRYMYPNFYWEIRPNLNYTIQHQKKFFFWQLEAAVHTEYAITKGLYLTTDIGINIDNNFEDYTWHLPDGKLHNVRQDRRLYLTEGSSGLRRMQLDYLVDIRPNIKGKLTAGYLEWMYGGIGGEILYIPDHKRWGIGIDAYWVKQREYDQKFSFRDYQTTTGFLSYYQNIPFYDMRIKISAGRFLGKDVGAIVDVSRRFKTGARVGGFVALTDCDPACVGEGSFHKGVYFQLPMDLFYVQSTTRKKTDYSWSPLTKNAGAKIEAGNLFDLMTDASDQIDELRQKPWSIKKIFSGFGTKEKDRI